MKSKQMPKVAKKHTECVHEGGILIRKGLQVIGDAPIGIICLLIKIQFKTK